MLKPTASPDNNWSDPRKVLWAIEELVKWGVHWTVLNRFQQDGEWDPANPCWPAFFEVIAWMWKRALENWTMALIVRERKKKD